MRTIDEIRASKRVIVKDVTLDGFVGEIVFYKWRGSLVPCRWCRYNYSDQYERRE